MATNGENGDHIGGSNGNGVHDAMKDERRASHEVERDVEAEDKDEQSIKRGEIFYNRGLSNACLMKFDEAIDDYKEALTRSKQNGE